MKKSHLFVVLLFSFLSKGQIVFAQNPRTQELNFSQWYLRSQGYTLSKTTGLTLGVYEYNADAVRIFEIPLLLRVDLSKNLSVLGGATFDFYQTTEGFSSDFDTSATFGIQYEVNNDAYIQGLFNYQIHSSNNPYNYKFDALSSFSIRTGFKF